MNNVQENIARASQNRKTIEEHCLARRIVEDETMIQVYLPPGYAVDCIQSRFSTGPKYMCYAQVARLLEEVWKKSML